MQLNMTQVANSENLVETHLLGYVFQPVVNQSHSVVGFEALARCSSIYKTDIYSGSAELVSNIPFKVQATEFFREVSNIVAVLGNQFSFSFNIEPVDCTAENLDLLCELSDIYKLPRKLIELELIETSSINLPGIALEKAKLCGFATALDDFGVGYSNFGAVLHYPFDTVKFDRMFLSPESGELSKDMLLAIHKVVKKSGFRTVIEGVENQAHLEFVKTLNADNYQGWFFGAGLSVRDLLSLYNVRKLKLSV